MGSTNHVLDEQCTLAPPGKYDGMICEAMRAVTAITAATCLRTPT